MFLSILRTPGVLAVYVSSFVGRIPAGAMGLLLILHVRETTGSYAAGGLVAGAFSIAGGISSPLQGRLVDRRGQGLVLCVCAVAFGASVGALGLLGDSVPLGVTVVLAALGGASMPPLSACQRALWADMIEPKLRHGAYALDSVIFELVYICGPLVLVGVVGAWSLRAAVVVAAVVGTLGALAFAATRLSRAWRPHPHPSTDPLGPLRGAGVRTILVALGLFAVGIAGMEIALAAFSAAEGSKNAVGVLLALSGVGSMVGGLVFGHLAAPRDAPRRLAVLLLALAVLEIPMALARDFVAMGIAVALAGAAIAPALSLAFRLLSEVAPPGTVTEAQSWVTSAIGLGIAGGSVAGGWMIERVGTTGTLWGVVGAGVAAAAVVWARTDTMRVDVPPRSAPAWDASAECAPSPIAPF